MADTSSRTNLGPLTTTFTPAPDCTVNAYYGPGQTGVFFQGQYCYDGSIRDQATCRPTATVTTPNPPLYAWGFYSPGLHCPSGYVTACASTAQPTAKPSGTADFQFDYPLEYGETAIGCCPTGLSCHNGGGPQVCLTFTSNTIIYPAGYCGSGGPGFSEIGAVTMSPNPTATIQSAAMFAPLIQIVFQSSDHPVAVSSMSTTTAMASLTATTTSVASLPSVPSTVDQNTGLSSGAKIGLGVGLPLAVILLVALAAVILLYRKERNKNRQLLDLDGHRMPQMDKPMYAFQSPVEVHGKSNSPGRYDAYRHGPVELNNTTYYQMSELSGG